MLANFLYHLAKLLISYLGKKLYNTVFHRSLVPLRVHPSSRPSITRCQSWALSHHCDISIGRQPFEATLFITGMVIIQCAAEISFYTHIVGLYFPVFGLYNIGLEASADRYSSLQIPFHFLFLWCTRREPIAAPITASANYCHRHSRSHRPTHPTPLHLGPQLAPYLHPATVT